MAEVRKQAWTGSVPPRGSGWVQAQRFWIGAYGVPTRYREVVLTVSKHVAHAVEQEVVLTVSKRGNSDG